MTTNVTVWADTTSNVLVPFNSAANAALAQAVLDEAANVGAKGGFLINAIPTSASGSLELPPVFFLGGVVDTVPSALNFGILPTNYISFVNAGSGLAAFISPPQGSTLISGTNAQTLFMNQGVFSEAYLGGGNNVVSNAFPHAQIKIHADGSEDGVLGGATLIVDDSAGGLMNVFAGNGLLVQAYTGGIDSIIGQAGTVAVLVAHNSDAASGVLTIGAAGPGSTLWVGAQGGPVFLTPGAGDIFVFQAGTGENAVSLFGGLRGVDEPVRDAVDFTGRATVLGMNGWLEAGSAGGSILQSGTTAGAATLVAGGAGDILLLQGANDVARLGDALNVFADASNGISVGGASFYLGSGSGTVAGASDGHNSFVFQGAGNYTVAGFHDRDGVAGDTLTGSVYYVATGGHPGGNITILDFLPRQVLQIGPNTVGGAIFDTVVLGNQFGTELLSLESLSSTELGGGYFNNQALLSDGTTINFLNTFGAVHASFGEYSIV